MEIALPPHESDMTGVTVGPSGRDGQHGHAGGPIPLLVSAVSSSDLPSEHRHHDARGFTRSPRRSLLRALTFLGAALTLACSDLLFGGGHGGVARVIIEPRFAPREAAIYASLPKFGLIVESLRLVLIRPGTVDTLKDTTVAILEGQDSIVVALQVALTKSEERLTAVLEMRSGSMLLFSGTVSVTAYAGANPTAPPPPVLVPLWVGPGAAASKVRISPRDTTIAATGRITFAAVATTVADVVVSEPEFVSRLTWANLDPALGTIPSAGGDFVGAGVRGTARITVATPNLLRDTVRVTLIPAATQVVTVSGSGQTGSAGTVVPLPFVVEVRAADNLGVPNVKVRFRAVAGGGSISPDSTMTNAQGRAQASLTLGIGAASQSFDATVTGLAPAVATATAVFSQVPSSIAFANGIEIVDVGSGKSAPAIVRAQDGTTMAGQAVTYTSRDAAIASVSSAGTITAVAKGQTVIVATLGALADSIRAVVAEPNGPVLVTSADRFRYPRDTTMTIAVFVDMRTSAKKLGSATIDVEWSPTQLLYQSHANGASGVSPTINAATTSTGKLTLAMADVTGFSGRVELLRITFKTATGAATGTLKAVARELNAHDFTDLLPLTVQVTHALVIP